MDFAFRESTLVRNLYNPDYTAWLRTWSGTVAVSEADPAISRKNEEERSAAALASTSLLQPRFRRTRLK